MSPRRRVAFAASGLILGGIVAFGVIAPPEHCPQPTTASIDQATDASLRWFERNQRPDGSWLYQYDRSTGESADAYNLVRHAGAVMGLYQDAAAGKPGALETADRGMGWARDRLVDQHGWTALAEDGDAPSGGTALLLAGMVERRNATGDTTDDELMRAMGRFLQSMTLPDGAVVAEYDTTTQAPVAASRSKYYTGETYMALAKLHRTFPQDSFGATSDRIGNYLATQRDDVEDHWPPVPDHWVAYGLAETTQFPERDPHHPLTDAELAYARSQAALFGDQVRWVAQQAGPWGVVVRGTKVPRGGGYGVVGEALTGLWRVAQADDRLADLRRPLADRAECIAGLSIDAQRHGGPAAEDGAWFIGDVTRMDDQQHATSALLRTTAIVELTPSSGHPAPSAWLWGPALLAVLNPLVVGLAVPARPRRGDRANLAALGGVIGGAIVVVAGALGAPLFEALDVSRPAGRLAVGIVAGVLSVLPLVRGAPRPADGPPGLRAAVVPVAVPLVAGPAIVLLALAAGADLGVGFVAGVMAIGVGLVTAATLVPAEGRGRVVGGWGVRLIAAVAVAACALLVVNAVLDV